ncbi:MAG: BppU family phage baseplate upper protein [Clostridium sp.]|uniref:BppU family phage baseplate upper protein n=1 Tax=Clostridium sp. TaxID=1506 RepID=UPI002904EBC8|nr:BppU family phage baseplate upper protein [Clostridium sp.]MDU1126499.1 BppU family phage baseplate upper protein [Clostridium sp.]MDU3675100.1 BppU family phage baseplate upper protein [Clostridium sp.]MDU6873532.1 BppU family phage baseplate upper protein [Clostridium sp.]MDU6934745.1 BppU family phage baseplate upper protein [Clostridium sp.]
MKYLREVKVDLSKNLHNNIQVKQSDNARYLLFRILDNGVPFSLENKNVRCFGKKPDGKEIYNDMSITNATKGECELRLTSGALSAPGILQLEIEIKENENTISTFILDVDIKKSLRSNSSIESSNEFTALENGITKLDEWDKYFKETSGAIEEKYTERLNGIDSSLEKNAKLIKCTDGEAITLEIASYSSSGFKIKFPRGILEITQPIYVCEGAEIDFNYCTIKRKTGTTPFDMIKTANPIAGFTGLKLKNLIIDGNKDIDNLTPVTPAHRFSGLRLDKVKDFYLENITVTGTVNAENKSSDGFPASGIFFVNCEGEAHNINGYNNDRTAIFLWNSNVQIYGGVTHDNKGSGISSDNSDYSGYFNLVSYNNEYSNISINGLYSKASNILTYNSKYSGLNVGHNGYPSDFSQINNIISYNNAYEGYTIGGSKFVQSNNIETFGNTRHNIRIFDGSSNCKLLNINSHKSGDGFGVFFETGIGHMIDNASVNSNAEMGIYCQENTGVNIGNNVECNNNGQKTKTGSGIVLNKVLNANIGTVTCCDTQTEQTQESGIWCASSRNVIINQPKLKGNKTYDIRMTGENINLKRYIETEPMPLVSENDWIVTARYERTIDNTVIIQGFVNGGSPKTVCSTLPVGFRPDSTMKFTSYKNDNSIGVIQINPNGEITPLSFNDLQSFSISFKQRS